MAKKDQKTGTLVLLGVAALVLLLILRKRAPAAPGAGGAAGSAGGNIIAGATGSTAGYQTGATAPGAATEPPTTVENAFAFYPFAQTSEAALPGLTQAEYDAIAAAEGGAIIS